MFALRRDVENRCSGAWTKYFKSLEKALQAGDDAAGMNLGWEWNNFANSLQAVDSQSHAFYSIEEIVTED